MKRRGDGTAEAWNVEVPTHSMLIDLARERFTEATVDHLVAVVILGLPCRDCPFATVLDRILFVSRGQFSPASKRARSTRRRPPKVHRLSMGPGVTSPKSRPSGMWSRPRWRPRRSRLSSRARYFFERSASISSWR
jgi:hypothetical protein